MHVVDILDVNMNRINTHFSATKPTFQQLVDYKNRYENGMFVATSERFADFELFEGARKERLADEEKKAELERIKREQGAISGLTEGGTN